MKSRYINQSTIAVAAILLSTTAANALDCTAVINRDIAGLGFEPYHNGSGTIQKGIGSAAYKTKRQELEREKANKYAADLTAFTSRNESFFKTMPTVTAEFENLDELERVKADVIGIFESRLDRKLDEDFRPRFASLEKDFGLDETKKIVLGWDASFDRSVRMKKSTSTVEVFLSNNNVSAYVVTSSAEKKFVFLNDACEIKRIEVQRTPKTSKEDGSYFTLSARFCSDPKQPKRLYELSDSTIKVFADACESTGGVHDGSDRRSGSCRCFDSRVLTHTSKPTSIALGCGSVRPVVSESRSILLSRFPDSDKGLKDALAICASQSGNFESGSSVSNPKPEPKKLRQ